MRPVSPCTRARATSLPTALVLRTLLGAGLVSGGFVASCTEQKGDVKADRTDKTTTASTASLAVSASASCSASEHVVPHLPPSSDNDVGGKMVAVKPAVMPKPITSHSAIGDKCVPGDPLCPL